MHEKRQLANVRFVVWDVLVPHARDRHDVLTVEHGDIHVTDHHNVAFGIALLSRVGGSVVVGNDGLSLPNRFTPETRGLHRINDRLVDHGALCHGRSRPGMHGEDCLILVHEGEVAYLALGEANRFFQSKVRDFLHWRSGHLAELHEGFQTGPFQEQCPFRMLALFLESDTMQRESNVSRNLLEQSPFLMVDRTIGTNEGTHYPKDVLAIFQTGSHCFATEISSGQWTVAADRSWVFDCDRPSLCQRPLGTMAPLAALDSMY